jgi:hypothetical protein
VSVQDKLDERFRNMRASAVFGAKTELYILFSALSESLDTAIVADNFIAEPRCGELYLPEAPLGVILEAILQSARVAPDSFVVESTPEYVFLRAAQNQSPPSVEIGSGPPDPSRQALLEKKVSLVIPPLGKDGQADVFAARPIPLHAALQVLTEQLGIEVVAQKQLANIPINPCVLKGVRLSTALDLLIRQWPVPEFGWEVQPERILIRKR